MDCAFCTAERINGRVLWANVLSLFCITLFPFATGWFGKNVNSLVPAMLYGTIFWATTVTFGLLQYSLVQCNGEGSRIYKALAGDRKPLISGGLGFVFIFLAFVIPILTPIADLVISAMWFIPPKSIERTLSRL
jgi:uncharacterized membrane protein